jgi:ribosomal protein S18 acetylase RimI-like enzyme
MIEIRPATSEDIPFIVRLIQELAVASGETSPLDDAYVVEYLSSPYSQVLLADDASNVAGLLSYSVKPNLYHAGTCCMVEELVVTSEKRSLGIGGALLDALMSRAEAEGWADVSVGVMPGNHLAQAFYRRHGLVDEALLLERHIGGRA